MKTKQLEAIKKQHAQYLVTGLESAPELNKFIGLAIVGGNSVKLRTTKEIVDICRRKLVDDRYNRNLLWDEIFCSSAAFEQAFSKWKKQDLAQKKKISAYRKVAEPLIRRAEFNDDSDPVEISAALQDAATESGLIVL